MSRLSQSLTELAANEAALAALRQLKRGIEKESLRVAPDGNLSMQPHPEALGSALTHPSITTDFSEAQLELITGVHESPEACLAELDKVHNYVFANIGDEQHVRTVLFQFEIFTNIFSENRRGKRTEAFAIFDL